jgi:hypothetical protein
MKARIGRQSTTSYRKAPNRKLYAFLYRGSRFIPFFYSNQDFLGPCRDHKKVYLSCSAFEVLFFWFEPARFLQGGSLVLL